MRVNSTNSESRRGAKSLGLGSGSLPSFHFCDVFD
jgi:hypothetical protein